MPAFLIPYGQRTRPQQPPVDGAVHFFLDDYRFESVWARPRQALPALRPYPTLLTPDFSLYRDWPLTLQLWNTYRSRWCGCFWAAQGFRVIPTVSWSDAASYPFCFLGLPRRSLLALSAVGVRESDPLGQALFLAGFREMVRRLEPLALLSYGPLPVTCQELVAVSQQPVAVTTYPTRWTNIRAARRINPMRKEVA